MKNLFILTALLSSVSAISQDLSITPTQINDAYNRELQYQNDLQTQQGVIEQLTAEIVEISAESRKTAQFVTDLVDRNETLTQDNFKLIRDQEKSIQQSKRFSLGVFAGYGVYASDSFGHAPMIGVGVSYSVLRF